jgi:hypothetical protein
MKLFSSEVIGCVDPKYILLVGHWLCLWVEGRNASSRKQSLTPKHMYIVSIKRTPIKCFSKGASVCTSSTMLPTNILTSFLDETYERNNIYITFLFTL